MWEFSRRHLAALSTQFQLVFIKNHLCNFCFWRKITNKQKSPKTQKRSTRFLFRSLSLLCTLAGVSAGLLGISCHTCACRTLEESRPEAAPRPNCRVPAFAPESRKKQTRVDSSHGPLCFFTSRENNHGGREAKLEKMTAKNCNYFKPS